MTWLLNVYWFSLGIGGIYILVAGALGAIGAAGHGAPGGHALDGGHDFGSGHAAGAGHDFDSGHALDTGHDGASGSGHGADSQIESQADPAPAAHGSIIATHQPEGGSSPTDISPFNLLNMMCLLAGFGGSGLALLASGVPALLTFPLALALGVLVTGLFHWVVNRVLMRMQAVDTPTQFDMLGLEAEVLVPLEGERLGEVAYVLDGQRFTSPARLLAGGRAGRKDPVRIVKVEGSTVYVEPQHRLLD
jgi:membrane protein implicated in regulation of membrane protease activity